MEKLYFQLAEAQLKVIQRTSGMAVNIFHSPGTSTLKSEKEHIFSATNSYYTMLLCYDYFWKDKSGTQKQTGVA